MKRFSYINRVILPLFLVLLYLPFKGYSTHIVGGALTYTYTGGTNYTINLKLWRDCAAGNTAYQNTYTVEVRNSDGSTTGLAFTNFTVTGGTITNVPSNLDTCADPPNPMPCVEERTYTANISLPLNPGGYHMFFSILARNNTVTNMRYPCGYPGCSDVGEVFYAKIPGPWIENFAMVNGSTVDNGLTAWTKTNGSPGPTSASVNTGVYNVTDNGTKSWLEDFPTNGATSDNGTTAWTRTLNAATSAQVANTRFEIRGAASATPVWTSSLINVSSFADGFNLNAAFGQANNAMENTDSIFIYYSLNGGPETLFSVNGKMAGNIAATTASTNALSGSTVQIIVRAKFDATNSGTEVFYFDNVTVAPLITNTWTSEIIDISDYPLGVNLSADLAETSTLDANDTIQVYYSLNGGPLTLFTTNGQYVDDFTSGTATANNIVGNTVRIYVKTKFDATTAATVTYTADNIKVVPNGSVWLEDFTLANGTTNDAGATSWSRTMGGTPTATAQVNGNLFEVTGANNGSITWSSQSINISSYTSGVDLTVALTQAGTLENTDSAKVYYSLNGGPLTLFTNNGRLAGNFASATASTTNLIGSTVQIYIIAKFDGASPNTEIIRWDNVQVSSHAAYNSSPNFGNAPPLFLCKNRAFTYDHSAVDIDGDSLVYSFYTPYDTVNGGTNLVPYITNNVVTFAPIDWNTGYSASSPLNANGPALTLDPQTGILSGTPNTLGKFVVGIKVSEYRGGKLLSEVARDYQFSIATCYDPAKAYITTHRRGDTLNVCNGNSITFPNNTTGTPTKWFWDFGDPAVTNDTSNVKYPVWSYPTPGTYTVMLVANPRTGCADTAYAKALVGWVDAKFVANKYNPCINTSVTFKDSISTKSTNANITNYCWDYGDGTPQVCGVSTKTVTHTYTTAGTYTVTETVYSSLNCSDTAQKVITVYPVPTASVSSAGSKTVTICVNTPTIAISGTSNVSALWSSTGTGNFNPNNTTSATTYSLSTADKSLSQLLLILTATGQGGCSTLTAKDTIVVNITPLPTANVGIPSPTTVCANNKNIDLTLRTIQGGTGAWTTSGNGQFNPTSDDNATEYVLSNNDIATNTVALYLTVTGNGACGSIQAKDTLIVYITPEPIASVGAVKFDTVCSNAAAQIAGSATNGTGVWSTTGDGTFYSDNSVTNANQYILGTNDKANLGVKLYLSVTGANGCSSVTDVDSLMLTITPEPIASVGTNKFDTVCSNAPAQIAGSASNGTGVWSTTGDGTFSLDNSVGNANAYNLGANDKTNLGVKLYLSVTGTNGCSNFTAVDSLMLTITPEPIASVGTVKIDTVCSNVPVPIAGNATNGTGVWSTSGDGTFSLDNSVGNANAYNLGANDKANLGVKLYLTVTGANGCSNVTAVDSLILTITPEPIANVGVNKFDTICSNAAAPIAGSASNGTGVWSTSGDGTFSLNNSVGNSNAYNLGTNDKANLGVKLYLSVTGTNGCSNVTAIDSLMLTVTPEPIASVGVNKFDTICSNAAAQIAGSASNGTGVWSTSGDGTFSLDNSVGNANAYNLGTNDKANLGVKLYLSVTGANGCSNVTAVDSLMLTITPEPVASVGVPNPYTFCSTFRNVDISTRIINNGTGVWTTTGTGSFDPSADENAIVYKVSDADTAAHTVKLVLTVTGSNGCANVQDKDSTILNILPGPQAYVGTPNPTTVCASNRQISLAGRRIDNGVGAWTSSGTGSFNPSPDATAFEYVLSNADTAARTIDLYLTVNGANGCASVQAKDTLTVNITPLPVATLLMTNDTSVCANVFNVPIRGTVRNGTGAWSTYDGTGWFLPNNLLTATSYSLSLADTSARIAHLVLNATGTGVCSSYIDKDTLTIRTSPPPSVSVGVIGRTISVCNNLYQFQLNGNVNGATGGIWTSSGTGTFIPDDITLNAAYHPSNADTARAYLTLTLTSTGNGACNPVQDTLHVIINEAPHSIYATANSAPICKNDATLFDASASNGIVPIQQYIWQYGDGNTNTVLTGTPPVSYTYGNDGIYSASLTVVDANGCRDSSKQWITVHSLPTANYSNTAQCFRDSVYFTDLSTITIINGDIVSSWQWNFGDGGASALRNPGHMYPAAGFYTATLVATSNFGCVSAPAQQTLNATPSPSAIFGSTSVCLHNTTQFLDSSVSNGTLWGINIISDLIYFGDGGSNNSNPGNAPTHVYTVAGTYTATQIVVASNGCSDTLERDVIIHPLPIANFIANGHCMADTIHFVDNSTISTGSVVRWQWNFGNGNQGIGNDVYNKYTLVGLYGVELTVTSDFGCTDDTSMIVTIDPSPNAAFSTDQDIVILHTPIQYTDNSTGDNINSWKWDFGDTLGTSNTQNPSYVYDSHGGIFVTKLVVTNTYECSDSAFKEIIVKMPPKIPNAFTPNGDGKNEILYVMGGPYKKMEFKILNNWGEIIFVTTNPSIGWDGTKNGVKQPIGVYIYMVTATTLDNEQHTLYGDVTLLR